MRFRLLLTDVPQSAPGHEALRLVVNTRAGHRPDDRPEWKLPRGRPQQTWIRQLEVDVGLSVDVAWDMDSDPGLADLNQCNLNH